MNPSNNAARFAIDQAWHGKLIDDEIHSLALADLDILIARVAELERVLDGLHKDATKGGSM